MKLRALMPVFLLLLSGCIDFSTPDPLPSINFRQYSAIYFNVSSIEVVEDYQSPMRPPYLEHLMPFSPADAMTIWVKQRMKASGGTRSMQVIIKDASVIERASTAGGGVLDFTPFTRGRDYDVKLEVEVLVYGEAALSEASLKVSATRNVSEAAMDSEADRNATYAAMMRNMMTEINAQMEKNIYQHLGSVVDYSR